MAEVDVKVEQNQINNSLAFMDLGAFRNLVVKTAFPNELHANAFFLIRDI